MPITRYLPDGERGKPFAYHPTLEYLGSRRVAPTVVGAIVSRRLMSLMRQLEAFAEIGTRRLASGETLVGIIIRRVMSTDWPAMRRLASRTAGFTRRVVSVALSRRPASRYTAGTCVRSHPGFLNGFHEHNSIHMAVARMGVWQDEGASQIRPP